MNQKVFFVVAVVLFFSLMFFLFWWLRPNLAKDENHESTRIESEEGIEQANLVALGDSLSLAVNLSFELRDENDHILLPLATKLKA